MSMVSIVFAGLIVAYSANIQKIYTGIDDAKIVEVSSMYDTIQNENTLNQ